jgi:hypothetical protein
MLGFAAAHPNNSQRVIRERIAGSTSTYCHTSLRNVGADAMHVGLVRQVRQHELGRLAKQRRALGAVGHQQHALVDGVECGQLETRQVAVADRRAVHVFQGELRIGLGGGGAEAPHLQLAGARGLHVLGPLRGVEAGAQADGRKALGPGLVELPLDLR